MPGSADAAGLVANGTFETGTTGWFATPSSTGALTRASGGHTGSYAARVANGTSAAATTVLNDSVNTVASTVAGTTYRASAWVRTNSPSVSLVIRGMEVAGSTTVTSQQTSAWVTDTAWRKISVDVKAARSGSALDLNVLAWNLPAGRSFYVDDVSLSTVTTTTSTSTSTSTSTTNGGVLPAQGSGALFGYYQSGGADVRPMETKIGRKFDLVHHYDDFNFAGTPWPSAAEVAEAKEGRTVHITWELTSYKGTYDAAVQPAPGASVRAPDGTTDKIYTYKQVLNGSLNTYLDKMADRVKAQPYRFVVDINHEMDDLPDIGGSNTVRAAAGSRAEYKAAYRYIVDRFRARGVTNVVWAWMVSGWYAQEPAKQWSYQQLWPGSSYVSLVLWDPYNYRPERWKTFSTMVTPFYNAFRGGMLDAVDPNAKRLPLGLGEYGCVADSRRPAWLKSMPTEAKAFPGIVTLGYFSSGSWGALHEDPTSISAFGTAGANAYLKTRG